MSSSDNTKSRSIPPGTASEGNPPAWDGILDAALEIAASRREALGRLRKALKANNAAEVFRAAKELCGLYDEKGNRVN
jgi:hypothetical protein